MSNSSLLTITHDCGFFSCSSVRLDIISKYIVDNKKLPEIIDCSKQFSWYKPEDKINEDITNDYFERFENVKTDIDISNIEHYNNEFQYINYADVNYSKIYPLMKKYFSPSTNILNKIQYIYNKYNLDYDNICVLFYRGNDKITETQLSSYEDYLIYSNEIFEKNPNIIFLIQSDETEFIEYMTNIYPNNSIYFKDEIRHMNKTCNTVDKVMKLNIHEYSMYYLAITIIMSKCKYIICGTGNCSIWIMLYRNNNKNTIQFIREKWIKTLE